MKKIITLIIGAIIIFGGMQCAKKMLYTDGSFPCWGKYNVECKKQ